MDHIIEQFWEALGAFLKNLDWIYMIMLILIVKLLEAFFPDHVYKVGSRRFRFKTKYRVPLIGLIMGIISYVYNGFYDRQHAMMYFQSMLTAMAFYMWFLDALLMKLVEIVPGLAVLKDTMRVDKKSIEPGKNEKLNN